MIPLEYRATIMGTVDNKNKVDKVIPLKEQRRIRDARIRALSKSGYSMNEICRVLNVSKTTVFFAVNGKKKKNKSEKHITK